jgi:hypothetical protein
VLTLVLPPSATIENTEPAMVTLLEVFLPGRNPSAALPWWADLLWLSVSLLPFTVLSIGMFMAAALLASSLGFYQARAAGSDHLPARRNQDGSLAGASLVLCGLVVATTLYNLYWLTVWDHTTDGWEHFLLIFPIMTAILCGSWLSLSLRRKAPLTGLLYAILIPALLTAVFALARRMDYRALTAARAERVSQAIAAYYDSEGRYPQDLGQLTPWYILSLPGPVIINGQAWCYEGSQAGYQFGYVDREHWSSPILTGRSYEQGGIVPDPEQICAVEIEALTDWRGW